MAASPVNRRYTSAVYEDKYFPEKNAAIPFKWETSPGRPKYDDDDDDHYEDASKYNDKEGSCMCNMCNESYTSTKKDNDHCMQASHIHIPRHAHAMSIYPLRPPPKLAPASPLRVKDLLLHSGMRDLDQSEDRFDDDQLQQLSPHDSCSLHAYHRGFSRLSFRFRSLKASTIVPIHKNYCMIKPQQNLGVDRSQASRLVVHAPFQGRSQSFSHAAMHGAVAAAKRAAANVGSNGVVNASAQVPGRRCNSLINIQSASKAVIDHDNKVNDHDDVDDDPSSMAAAAVWAGACILAAAAVHDVVSADHHQHDPCRVARKLRDLMQQSANFSELELPMSMMTLKKGGGSTINENLTQLALCQATVAPAAKRKTKPAEEEVMDAFLGEDIEKSCTHDDDVEGEPTLKDKATLEGDDDPHKVIVKKNSFFKVFKNECIACWCPSSTL